MLGSVSVGRRSSSSVGLRWRRRSRHGPGAAERVDDLARGRDHAARPAVEAGPASRPRPRAGRPRPSGRPTARRRGSPAAAGASAASASDGNGQRVIGRKRPAREPVGPRALDRRPGDARRGAVGRRSRSRRRRAARPPSGPRASAIVAELGLEVRLCASRSSGWRWSERTTRGGRPSAPVSSQPPGCARRRRGRSARPAPSPGP